MKNWILSCVLIVSPVMAAEGVISLEQGQSVTCPSASGCIAMTKDMMRQFLMEVQIKIAAGCKEGA